MQVTRAWAPSTETAERARFIQLVEEAFRTQFEEASADLVGVGRLLRLSQISDIGTHGVERAHGPLNAKTGEVAPVSIPDRHDEWAARRVASALVADVRQRVETAKGRVEMADPPEVMRSVEGPLGFIWAATIRVQPQAARV